MQFMYQYPEPVGTDRPLGEAGAVTDVARRVEAAGWDGIAFTEHPAPGANWLSHGGHQTLDPFIALTAAAAVTDRIKLLTYLAVLPYRNPLLLAKTAASVDIISNGRFVLGVGTGYLKSEFYALGVDFAERNAAFDEALDVMAMHWSGEPFTYSGRDFNARDVLALPAPPQQPIPIWIGGNSGITLRRVAERCQGWMPLIGGAELSSTTRTPPVETVDDLAAQIERLEGLAGERAGDLDILVPYMDFSIHDLETDVERHRDMLGKMKDAGATWVAIMAPETDEPAATEFIDGFAANYLDG